MGGWGEGAVNPHEAVFISFTFSVCFVDLFHVIIVSICVCPPECPVYLYVWYKRTFAGVNAFVISSKILLQ